MTRVRTVYSSGVLLKVAYDGRNYSGLAIQSNANTVAAELTKAVRTMDPEASSLRVCSRTDAGVHARGQYVVFDTNQRIGMRGWVLGLSGELPGDVAVLSAARVAPQFQPSKHALSKTYHYWVLQGTVRDPFLDSRSWRVFERLNHERMQREANDLIGTHDFRAFRGRSDFRTETTRTIFAASVRPVLHHPRLLEISITGSAFLYHMVRIIAGTLVDVGRGRRQPGAVRRALEAGDRLLLGMTAPAEGLFLDAIELDDRGEDEWPYHLDGAPTDE